MGGELAQEQEWSHDRSLDWHLLENPGPRRSPRARARPEPRLPREPALWERDFDPSGFAWLEANDGASNVLAFVRFSGDGARAASSASATSRTSSAPATASALPHGGAWHELVNSDDAGATAAPASETAQLVAEEGDWMNQPWSAELTLPPLAVIWLDSVEGRPDRRPGTAVPARRDSRRRGDELRALLRARRAGRALPLRRRRHRDPPRADRARTGSTGTPTCRASARDSATATASTAPTPPNRGTASTRPSS